MLYSYQWGVSKEAQSLFEKQGVIKVDHLYSPEKLTSALDEIITIESNHIALHSKDGKDINVPGFVTENINGAPHAKYIQSLYKSSPIFRMFADFRLMSIVSNLLGKDDIYLSDIEVHIRNPGGTAIPKHQDNFYFNLANAKGVTCYIPLSEQDPAVGGLQYLTGSHFKRVRNHKKSSIAAFSSELDSEQLDSNLSVMKPVYKPGDLTIHHPENIHFADPVPDNSHRTMALSVRLFSGSENIDSEAFERYKNYLNANRGK